MAATGEDVLMRHGVPLVLLMALVAGCGARTSNPGVGNVPEKMTVKGSSRIAISYGGNQALVGEYDFTKDVGSFAWGSRNPDGQWDQIITPEATYARFPHEATGLSAAWVKVEGARKDAGLFGFETPSDPSRLLELLKAASSVHEVDSGQERGVAVRRYRASLDLDRALRELPASERDGVRSMIRQYWVDGAKEGIPLDLAIDKEGLLRRLNTNVPDGEELSIEFFDYGLHVVAKPPPPDQVLTSEEFSRLLRQSCAEPNGGEDGATACSGVGVHIFVGKGQ
jgi:hypothetical protein